VCINQSDDVEKSWQVQQMREVYTSAESTPVFLGPKNECSDAAIDLFHKTAKDALDHECIVDAWWPSEQFLDSLVRKNLEASLGRDIHPIERLLHKFMAPGLNHDYMPFHLVSAIMDRAWWTRIWVLQEMLLSRNPIFICGYKTIHLDILVAAIHVFGHLNSLWTGILLSDTHVQDQVSSQYMKSRPPLYSSFPAINLYIGRLIGQKLEEDFLSIFWLTQTCEMRLQATNLRDHIFPLLTFATSHDTEALHSQLDYALPVVAVYVNATVDLLRAGYTGVMKLAILRRSNTELDSLPSWVPDYSGKHNGGAVLDKPKLSNATMEDYLCLQNEVQILPMAGYIYGSVEAIRTNDSSSPPLQTQDSYLQHLTNITLIGRALSRCSKGPKNTHIRHAGLALSIILSDISTTRRSHPIPELQEIYDCISEEFGRRNDLLGDSEWNTVAKLAELLVGSSTEQHVQAEFLQNDIYGDVRGDFPELKGVGPWDGLDILTSLSGLDSDRAMKKSAALQRLRPAVAECSSWLDVGVVARQFIVEYTPFVCEEYVGVASVEMQTGDVLAALDSDPNSLFILRDVEGGLFKVVGLAFVAQLWGFEGSEENQGTKTTFRLC